ncbi:N-acetylglucosaminyldiphosphodolichol N-acetylglucosaminyltransferase catalytic subunit ALG13 [Sporobolomyces salmoneus]|uniref:N-acetylglucosaminyldiphosphodolichol N-acetylglucosaminyltransferase catalytic subunit ALG13 n=1 Tax=Sporobolomyces salmoneus TaxID=183962 RepID=UPI003175913F
MTKTALLTVGSTQFPSLVSAVLSPLFISQLASSLDITTLYAQIGHSSLPDGFSMDKRTVEGVSVEVVRFTNDLEERVGQSDLVISHAGAGSILSFLRPLPNSQSTSKKGKQRQLILVPNDTLMDSHQSDLADEMKKKGWAKICRDPRYLRRSIEELARHRTLKSTTKSDNEFPELDEKKVQRILDETLAYV